MVGFLCRLGTSLAKVVILCVEEIAETALNLLGDCSCFVTHLPPRWIRCKAKEIGRHKEYILHHLWR